MKTLRCLWGLCLMACSGTTSDTPDDGLTIASSDYQVLAQHALTAQAEADTVTLAWLLAPNVRFSPPDMGEDWLGRQAVLRGWQHWQRTHHIAAMRLHDLTHLPVRTLHPLSLTGKAGVHVVCYATVDTRYDDGRSKPLRLHACYHFDTLKRIDYGWLSLPPLP